MVPLVMPHLVMIRVEWELVKSFCVEVVVMLLVG